MTVENITLHNPRLIRERDLRIGDTVAVVRRGDVIPFAGRAIVEDRDGSEQEIVPPTHCPSCGHELEVRGTGEERWCVNLQCPAQATRRLMHWASRPAADMEGVGDVWIEKLADDGVLKRRSDFYELTAEQLIGYERMGEVSARNMVDAIEGSKGLGLRRALIGLAIPMASDGVGQAPVPGRLRAHRGRRWTRRVEDLVAIRDIGPKVAESVAAFFARDGGPRGDRGAARATASSSTCSTRTGRSTSAAAADSPLKGATVVVTGAFTHGVTGAKISRPDLTRLVEQAGATAASSVSAEHRLPAGGRERRRVEDRQGGEARRRGRRPGQAVGLAAARPAWPDARATPPRSAGRRRARRRRRAAGRGSRRRRARRARPSVVEKKQRAAAASVTSRMSASDRPWSRSRCRSGLGDGRRVGGDPLGEVHDRDVDLVQARVAVVRAMARTGSPNLLEQDAPVGQAAVASSAAAARRPGWRARPGGGPSRP